MADAIWTVFEALASEVTEIGYDKSKAKRANVIYCGEKQGAIDLIAKLYPLNAVVFGTATAGDSGTATAGDSGTATAGDFGTATAGYAGTATAGDSGFLNLRWWDRKRYRVAIFYVGEDGIEANVAYRCEGGKAIRAVK